MLIFTPYTQFQLGLFKMLKLQNWLNEIENLFYSHFKGAMSRFKLYYFNFYLNKVGGEL